MICRISTMVTLESPLRRLIYYRGRERFARVMAEGTLGPTVNRNLLPKP